MNNKDKDKAVELLKEIVTHISKIQTNSRKPELIQKRTTILVGIKYRKDDSGLCSQLFRLLSQPAPAPPKDTDVGEFVKKCEKVLVDYRHRTIPIVQTFSREALDIITGLQDRLQNCENCETVIIFNNQVASLKAENKKLKAEKPVCSLCGEPITEEYGPVSCHQSCVNGVVNAEEKPPESPSPVEGQDVGGNTSIEKIMSNILDIIIGLNVLNHYTDGSHKVKDYHAESLITELNNNWVYLQSQITGLQERVKELEATLQDGIDLYYSDVEGEYGWGLLGKWAGIVKRVLKNNPEKGDVRDG